MVSAFLLSRRTHAGGNWLNTVNWLTMGFAMGPGRPHGFASITLPPEDTYYVS